MAIARNNVFYLIILDLQISEHIKLNQYYKRYITYLCADINMSLSRTVYYIKND